MSNRPLFPEPRLKTTLLPHSLLPNPSYNLVTMTPLLQHLYWLTTPYPIVFRILCLAKPPLALPDAVLLCVSYSSGWCLALHLLKKASPPLLLCLCFSSYHLGCIPISIFLSLTYTPSSSHRASFLPLNLRGLYLNLFSDTTFCLNCPGTLTSYLLSQDRVSYRTTPGLMRDQTLLLEQGTLLEAQDTGRWHPS